MGQSIVIIEDEPAVAKGLIYGLKEEGFDVFWSKAAEPGLSLIREKAPHLLILDIRLPDISGHDVCRRLRAEENPLPIIMLTARDQEVDKVLGLELGADDYVVKPFSFRELVSRIHALLRRSYGELAGAGGREWFNFGEIRINMSRLQVFKGEKEIFLTPIEFKLLKYLIERPDRPISRDILIEAVWGANFYLEDERTVDVHIRHLREKLEQDPSQPEYIKTVRGYGYKFAANIKKS